MTTTGLNDLIDAFSNLPLEDKEYAVDVIKKQLIEAKRESLFKRTKQAEACLKKGMVKRGTVNTLREDLEND